MTYLIKELNRETNVQKGEWGKEVERLEKELETLSFDFAKSCISQSWIKKTI